MVESNEESYFLASSWFSYFYCFCGFTDVSGAMSPGLYRCSEIPGVLGLDPTWPEDRVRRSHQGRALPSAHQGQEEAVLAVVNGKTDMDAEARGKGTTERRRVWVTEDNDYFFY